MMDEVGNDNDKGNGPFEKGVSSSIEGENEGGIEMSLQ